MDRFIYNRVWAKGTELGKGVRSWAKGYGAGQRGTVHEGKHKGDKCSP